MLAPPPFPLYTAPVNIGYCPVLPGTVYLTLPLPAVFSHDSPEEGSDADSLASFESSSTLRANIELQRHQLAMRSNRTFLPPP